MILIADSGSTKTDWRLWQPNDNQVIAYSSKGLNPYFINSEEIASEVKSIFPSEISNKVEQIHFYGSGCSSNASKEIIIEGLQQLFTKAELQINHDLMGAAKALLGNSSGIACILGTGSNACYYDGAQIIEEGVSYGYIMGDEGSGNHLGRLLLKSIFSNKATQDLQEKFKTQFPSLDLSVLLKQLYHLPFPNRFLAGFSPFIYQNKEHDFIKEILYQSFNAFFEEFVMTLKKSNANTIGLQGSIAYYYKEEIEDVFRAKGFESFVFLEKPIESLLNYHKQIH